MASRRHHVKERTRGLALVGARLPVLGVGVALGDLVARVRVHAVATEQAPLEALLEGLVVGDGGLVAWRRHCAYQALVIAQSELWYAAVVRLCVIEE